MEMELLLSLAVGLGLSAACGFRIFVPLLVMSLAAKTGHLTLGEGFEWIGSTPAVASFTFATLLEVGAYYVPWLDNLLDVAATPSAVVAGVIATASQISELDPWMTWTIAVIGGGGVAGAVQGLSVITRQISAFATGGLGNPLVSTVEAGASIAVALMAIVLPLFAVLAVLVLLYFAFSRILRRFRSRGRGAEAQSGPPAGPVEATS